MKYLIPVFVLIFLVFPMIVQAQGGWGSIIYGTNLCSGLDTYAAKLCNFLWTIQMILYALGFGIAVIMIIVGGIQYMTSAGDEEKAKKARKLITNAIIGFIIVLAFSFIIGIVRELITNSLV